MARTSQELGKGANGMVKIVVSIVVTSRYTDTDEKRIDFVGKRPFKPYTGILASSGVFASSSTIL